MKSGDAWKFPDQIWYRGTTPGFKLGEFKGLDGKDSVHGSHELAEAVGAHECPEEGGGAIYPGPFRYSPATGRPLPPSPEPVSQTWLPPLGNQPSQPCLGLRQTPQSIALSASFKPTDRPDCELDLPTRGDYQFFVGNLKTFVPQLLAINGHSGQIYLRSGESWIPLSPRDRRLPDCSLGSIRWGVWLDEGVGNRLYLPTDEGLAILDINPLNASYRLTLIAGHCLGAPAVLADRVLVPAVEPGGKAGILWVRQGNYGETGWLVCEEAIMAGEFNIPIAEAHRVLWLNSHGQVGVKPNVDTLPVAECIPWPEGFAPHFEFGCVYYARNGKLWQIGYDEPTGRYHYVQLGRRTPERQPCDSPSLSSGTECFAQGNQLPGPPWGAGGLVDQGPASDVVVPLLEAADEAILCVRVAWIGGLRELFENPDNHLARYELIGHAGNFPFFSQKLPQPWLARPFVHRDRLYLYHPELDSIAGWKLA